MVNFGDLLATVMPLAMELGADLYDVSYVKPLPSGLIANLANYDIIVTLEQNSIVGGCYSLILEELNHQSIFKKVIPIAIADKFVEPMKAYEIGNQLAMNANEILYKLACAMR